MRFEKVSASILSWSAAGPLVVGHSAGAEAYEADGKSRDDFLIDKPA